MYWVFGCLSVVEGCSLSPQWAQLGDNGGAHGTSPVKPIKGSGNDDKQTMAPLNKPYYDTNTALFPSFTLSMHMCAISHWLSQQRCGWRVCARCLGHKLGRLAPTVTIGILL